MLRQYTLYLGTLALAFCSITCAPTDESTGPSGQRDPRNDGAEEIQKPAPLIDVPSHLQGRIDETLKSVRKRSLSKNNSFWTLFHGILGMGLENAYLFDAIDTKTGKPIKAIEYICQGNKVRGLDFKDTPAGVDVISQIGTGVGQGHQDQFIAEMAQWGMPKDRKFLVNGAERTFADFTRYAKARVRLTPDPNQEGPLELSWAILIVAQYYGTDIRWTNLDNKEIAFDDIVRFELKEPILDCPVCGGTHRLFGLTWAYHLHRQHGGKKEGVWLDVEKKLDEFKALARKYQNKDGSFSTNYFRAQEKRGDTTLRLATTGHILEWLSLALSDAELRQPWMQDAANSLCVLILENRYHGLDGGALYHAAHGLAIYRTRVFGPADAHPPLAPPPPKD
jgi:hypothetical protein